MPMRVGELHTAIHPELERRLVIKRDNRHEVIVLASLTPQPSGKRVSVIRRNATAHSALRITQDIKASVCRGLSLSGEEMVRNESHTACYNLSTTK